MSAVLHDLVRATPLVGVQTVVLLTLCWRKDRFGRTNERTR